MEQATEVGATEPASDLKARRLLGLFVALPIVLVMMFFVIVPTRVDESRLARALQPILERDYPGWHYEEFAY